MKFVEWRVQVAGLNALLVKVDPLVEGFVEVPADRVGAVGVTRFWIGHEIECAEKHSCPNFEYCAGVGEAGFGGRSFGLDPAELLPDFDLWKLIVREEVEESVLFGLEFFELAADGCVEFGDAALFSVQCLFEKRADVVDERRWKVQRRVVVDDRLFHFLSG